MVSNGILAMMTLLRNQIKRGELITALVLLCLASYYLSCASPPVTESHKIKIPETHFFESVLQYDRVYIDAARPPWTKIDLSVQKGDKILIFARGEATVRTIPNIPPYNLLQLKIGHKGIPEPAVLFDNQRYFKPSEIGRLMLAVNRWDKKNTGGFLIDLFVVPEDKEDLLLDAMQELSLHNPNNPVLKNQIKKFIELHHDLFFTDVEVASSPSNARVYLDGFYRGNTPFTLEDLKLHRTFEICMLKEGFPDNCYSLNPKKSINLFVELKKDYDLISAAPKELDEIKEDLSREKKKATLLDDKVAKLAQEKAALEKKLRTEADIKKRLEDSLIALETALKKKEKLVAKLSESERQLKSKLAQLNLTQQQSENYQKELNRLDAKIKSLNQDLEQANTQTATDTVKDELKIALEEKSNLEKETKNSRAKESMLLKEISSLKALAEKTRIEADDAKMETQALRHREKLLTAQVDELKERLNRAMAPVLVVPEPKNGAIIKAPATILHAIAIDDKGISKIEVVLNDVLIQSDSYKRGIKIASPNEASKKIYISKRLQLLFGPNNIKIKAIDTDGLITEEKITIVREKAFGEVWVVIIGINQYSNVRKLKYAVNDAIGFRKYVRKYLGITHDHIFFLIDQHATKSRIENQLGTQLKRKAAKEDTVIIFYAGHGAVEADPTNPDGDGFEKYLLPYDADLNDLYSTSISMDDIEKIFQRIRSERLIFIADTCYSGAAGGRSLIATNTRANLSDRFYERISKGKGRVIISSCSANEVSKEDDNLQHGVFSYYMLEGLKGEADQDDDGIISVSELFSYLSRKVPEASGQDQHPVKKGETEGELVIGRTK
jgi:hypothetical protein